MLYSYFVKKLIRQSFDHVNNHRWDEAVKAVAPHVHHRVSGAHALGGERHGKEALRRWCPAADRDAAPVARLTTLRWRVSQTQTSTTNIPQRHKGGLPTALLLD